jgi:hypothetical protein
MLSLSKHEFVKIIRDAVLFDAAPT